MSALFSSIVSLLDLLLPNIIEYEYIRSGCDYERDFVGSVYS